MRSIGWKALTVLGALTLGAPAVALAQPSNFGTVALRPGFTPDPHSANGTSGGQANATNVNSSCRGWIASNPDHVLQAQGHFNFLRIFAVSNGDTTLLIQTPNGQVRCNDDTFGTNPSVEGNFGPGTYRIWVGSYQQGQNSPYQLYFTELSGVNPNSLGGGGGMANGASTASQLDMTGQRSNFQNLQLQSGFMPDPMTRRGTSGGQVNANNLGGQCRGWVARTPDHFMNLQSNFGFMRVYASSNSDTTMVIRTPDGRFLCDDDSYGRNPAVEQASWIPGRYMVWVGSYRQGDNAAYALGVTEVASNTP